MWTAGEPSDEPWEVVKSDDIVTGVGQRNWRICQLCEGSWCSQIGHRHNHFCCFYSYGHLFYWMLRMKQRLLARLFLHPALAILPIDGKGLRALLERFPPMTWRLGKEQRFNSLAKESEPLSGKRSRSPYIYRAREPREPRNSKPGPEPEKIESGTMYFDSLIRL